MFERLREIHHAGNGGKMAALMDFNTSARSLIQCEASESEWIAMAHRIERTYGLTLYSNDSWAATDWFRYVRLKHPFTPEKII